MTISCLIDTNQSISTFSPSFSNQSGSIAGRKVFRIDDSYMNKNMIHAGGPDLKEFLIKWINVNPIVKFVTFIFSAAASDTFLAAASTSTSLAKTFLYNVAGGTCLIVAIAIFLIAAHSLNK